MRNRDPWAWAGIAVVGLTAIVWSFAALSDLAHMVGVTTVIDTWWGWQLRIAWGLPITVDVLAVVATRVWLRGTAPAEAITYACRAAWAAIGASIVGNGYHGLLVGNFQIDALIVSAVPAVVIGVIVHLAVLVGRPPKKEPLDEESTAQSTVGETGVDEFALPDRRDDVDTASIAAIADDLRAIAVEAGRPLTQDEVRQVYGIGADKAGKVRRQLGWWPRAVEQSDQAEVLAR
jgi:hypothetical protein